MATIALSVGKNLREKLGEEGTQEFISILNQMNTAQLEELERSNGRMFEKFQQELAHTRDLLTSQIVRSEERLRAEFDLKLAVVESRFAQLDTKFATFDTKFAEQRADLIKWMFIFWSTTIITIVAGYILK